MFTPELLWFLAGLALVLLEFQLPGVVAIFFGVGAWITALATWLGFSPTLTGQIWTFAISSTVLLVTLRRYVKGRFLGHASGEQDPLVNLDDFVGRIAHVTETIRPDDEGRVEFKGAGWEARTEGDTTLDVGEPVVIDRLDGLVLVVGPRPPRPKPGSPSS